MVYERQVLMQNQLKFMYGYDGSF